MKALDLDLMPRRRVPVAAWVVLAAACLASADAGLRWLALTERVDHAQGQIGAQRPRVRNPKPLDPSLARDLRLAQNVAQRLSMPWDHLFQAVETASSERVALLALSPDPQTGELSISGEAADYDAIVKYLERLGEAGRLSGVHLVRHEMKQDDPQHPLSFTIAASWRPHQP